MNKFLLITYYWPPCGGVSVQRWLNLTKYLLKQGWHATVLTTQDGDYPDIDESLLQKVSPEIHVVRTKTPTWGRFFRALVGKKERLPYGSLATSKSSSPIKRVLYFIRLQFVSPDSRVIWNKVAYQTASALLKTTAFDIVITTGPPHSTHLVGEKLKNTHHITWCADFRDPWSQMYYLHLEKRNIAVKNMDKHYEKRVLQSADQVVTISQGYAQLLSEPLHPIHIIANAFDPDDFTHHSYTRSDTFRVTFVGALTSSRAEEVLKAISWIDIYAQNATNTHITFTLIGGDATLTTQSIGLKSIAFHNVGFLSHDDVIHQIVNSEMLLLAINNTQQNSGIMTLKLYEYLASRTAIAAIAPSDSEVREILCENPYSFFVTYDRQTEFIYQFDILYSKWLKSESIKGNREMSAYSVEQTSNEYAMVLDKLVAGS